VSAYPDTSFLCAFYRQQDNTERALRLMENLVTPLSITACFSLSLPKPRGSKFSAMRKTTPRVTASWKQ
jgi:hypothetical protein